MSPARPSDDGRLIDRRAVAVGALLALAVAIPTIVIASLLGIDATSNAVFIAFLVYLAGLTVGGRLAARRRPDAPLSNGAMAALAAYAAIAVVVSVVRLARGRSLDPVSLVSNAFLAATFGLAGGLIATWRRLPSEAGGTGPTGGGRGDGAGGRGG
ncbi:MAG: hypothetical protein ABR511_10315, partial [Acidimicrobiales bacterium]